MKQIPLKFILAFFVPVVVDRWKRIFTNIGSVDKACLYINTYIRDPESTNDGGFWVF